MIPPTPFPGLAKVRWALLGLAGLVVTVQAGQAALGGEQRPLPLDVVVPVACGAIALFALTMLAQRGVRWSRRLFAAGVAAYATAEVGFYASHATLPGFPTGYDLLWLTFYPCTVGAIVLTARRVRSRLRMAIWLDALIVGLTLVGVAYELVLEPLHEGTAAPHALVDGQLAYPILDLVVLALFVMLGLGTRGIRASFVLITVGLAVLFVTDTANLSAIATGDGTPSALLEAGWPAGLLLFGIALQFKGAPVTSGPLRGRTFAAITGVAVVTSVVLLSHEMATDEGVPVVCIAGLVLLGVVARLLLALRENERLARDNDNILLAAGAGIVRLDASGSVTFLNPAAEELLDSADSALVGRTWHELMHRRATAEQCPLCRRLTSGEAERVQSELMWRADGTSFLADYTCAPLREAGGVNGSVIVFDNATSRRRLESQLREQADHDPLTGLVNRRRFTEMLDDQLAFAARTGATGALAIVDLDAFQFVNDSCGHEAGDAVLRRVAGLLAQDLGHGDVVARLGADEFAILLATAKPAAAEETVAGLLARIAEGTQPRTGATAGLALFDGALGLGADELLIAADIALFEAKEQGGGASVTYHPGEGQGQALTWVEQLREAIAEDHFALYGQPVVDLRTGELSYQELLVRMIGPDGDVIPPSAFLPTAERFGLICELDRLIVRKALAHAREGHRVAVNLSGRSLGDEVILGMVREELAKGLPPRMISFEITETTATTDLEGAAVFAGALADLGCGVAIDDFGTGFGSFIYLQRLPADKIKIDMQFVRELTRRDTDHHLVSALVGLAKSLGKETVAEGIEDAETLLLLQRLGVDYGQGYFIGRPAPLVDEPWAGGYQARAAIRGTVPVR